MRLQVEEKKKNTSLILEFRFLKPYNFLKKLGNSYNEDAERYVFFKIYNGRHLDNCVILGQSRSNKENGEKMST